MKPFEFQNYVISFIQGIHSPKLSGDFGIDGYTLFNRLPIQVKQQDHVGRPDVQKFESAIRKERKEKGYIFGLGFTKPAYDEAARIKMESNIEIILHTVQDLVSSDKSPDIL
jgi:restriction endonuclease Mrr